MIYLYHVYALDGYESAHRTERAARLAARRGAKRRGVSYAVIRCDSYGLTGGGRGVRIAGYDARGKEVR